MAYRIIVIKICLAYKQCFDIVCSPANEWSSPNTLYTETITLWALDDMHCLQMKERDVKNCSFFAFFVLRTPGWSDRPARIESTILVLGFLLWWLENLQDDRDTLLVSTDEWSKSFCQGLALCMCSLPGKSTSVFHRHSSCHQHCQIPHSNLELRITSPVASWQRIHTHPPQPERGNIGNKIKHWVTLGLICDEI